jgi:hypothetical protein
MLHLDKSSTPAKVQAKSGDYVGRTMNEDGSDSNKRRTSGAECHRRCVRVLLDGGRWEEKRYWVMLSETGHKKIELKNRLFFALFGW